jgi:hypothetical protein
MFLTAWTLLLALLVSFTVKVLGSRYSKALKEEVRLHALPIDIFIHVISRHEGAR